MKNKLKNYFKLGMLIFGVSTLIISCQKDDISGINKTKNEIEGKIASFQFITGKQLQKSKSINKALSKLIETEKQTKGKFNQRIIYSEVYDFSIDTDKSLLNTFDKYKTYTFKIIRDNPDDSILENLVIDLDTITGETIQLLYTYPIVNNNYDVKNVNVQRIQDINLTYARFSSDCISTVSYQTSTIDHNCGLPGNHPPGQACSDGIVRSYTETTGEWVETDDCMSSAGGDPYNNENSGTVYNGGSGNGNNNEDEDEPGIYTKPLDTFDECLLSDEDFNAPYTANSPFTVDLSQVRATCDSITTPENDKFLCIYKKLTQSPKFKTLFVDTFGESSEANITFELIDLPENIAGKNIANVGNIQNQVIQINKNHLNSKHPLTNAQTIIHEAIHAYLKVKAYECTSGTTIEGLNNQELDELLSFFDYDCLSTAVNEHDLMLNIVIPYMQQLLIDILPELVAPEDLNPDINFYPRPDEQLHQFDWTIGTYYMSFVGLGSAQCFQSDIMDDGEDEDLFNDYNSNINNSTKFNHSTCEN